MLALEILVNIHSGKRHEFLQAIDLFCREPETDHDCIRCGVFEAIDTPNFFLWMEKWTDSQSLDNYMQSDRFKALLGAIQVLGELYSVHKGEFLQLSDTTI